MGGVLSIAGGDIRREYWGAKGRRQRGLPWTVVRCGISPEACPCVLLLRLLHCKKQYQGYRGISGYAGPAHALLRTARRYSTTAGS